MLCILQNKGAGLITTQPLCGTDLDKEGNLVKLEEDAAAHVNPL